MMDFGISAEELRQTIVCISAQRLIRTSSGQMGAVFEIIQGDMLDRMTDSVMKGERVVVPENLKVESLIRKYSRQSVMHMIRLKCRVSEKRCASKSTGISG